jgi:hypothetical protein
LAAGIEISDQRTTSPAKAIDLRNGNDPVTELFWRPLAAADKVVGLGGVTPKARKPVAPPLLHGQLAQ